MKAIVIPSYGDADVLTLTEVPDPVCGPDDVVVNVKATALNRADLLQRRGFYPQPGPKPEFEIPGLEFAGEVAEAGSRVDAWKIGDRVMGLLGGGGYAEKVVTSARLVSPVPDGLSWAEAASLPEAGITAHDALVQCRMVAGETVLVHAAGSGVGSAAIQIARTMGAGLVLGTASAEKLEPARALGLDVGIDYKAGDFADAVDEATDGRGADVVLDFIGGSYLEQNLRALAVKGRMIVIGMMGGLTADLNLGVLLQKRLEIRGTLLRARTLEEKATATRAFEKSVLPHVAAGRVRAVVDRSFALAEAAEAHRLMESNANFGKIVLEM
jgi:NADPH2:quinone reductase